MNDTLHKYIDIVTFLGETVAKTYEVVLYDLTESDYPIIACEHRVNGTHKCNRTLIASILKSKSARLNTMFLNKPATTEQDILIKTSLYFIKDEIGANIGALCINVDCDVYLKLHSIVEEMLAFDLTEPLKTTVEKRVEYVEPSLAMIEKVVAECGIEPGRVSQNERIDIICDLYELGVYEIKGAVAKTAEVLKISEQSVYRYLSKIKKAARKSSL